MINRNPRIGRPPKPINKKHHVIKAKLTDGEFDQLLKMQSDAGINRTDLIKSKIFFPNKIYAIDSREILKSLDSIGTELGHAGNNINQLARLSHILHKSNQLEAGMQNEFNGLLAQYIKFQEILEKQLKHLLRELKKR